jgi:hypothetical protein
MNCKDKISVFLILAIIILYVFVVGYGVGLLAINTIK